MNVFQEIQRRGLVNDASSGLANLLAKSDSVAFYAGFDPTAPSLHIGNLVPLMAMRLLQKAGHKPYILLGGATGLVGDPSGKNQERPLLPEEVVQTNLLALRTQLEKFLSFEGTNGAVIVNNAEWFTRMGYLEFLRDAGKYMNVAYMISKDIVKRRLESGISYAEFSYQLIQAYDFWYLYTHYNVQIQLGGSDQWGNITAGIEFIHKKCGKEVQGFTVPLLTRADGSKFGKSEGDNIWLDPARTSSYRFYQYLFNTADEDVEKLLRVFGEEPLEKIEEIMNAHRQAPHLRHAQRHLAASLTRFVHGEEALQRAILASETLFGKGSEESLHRLGAAEVAEVFDTLPQATAPVSLLDEAPTVADLMAAFPAFFPSKSEVRRLIQAGGLTVNRRPVTDGNQRPDRSWLLHNRFLLVQKGKKHYFVLRFE